MNIKLVVIAGVTGVIASCTQGAVLYTSGAGDAVAYHDWFGGGDAKGVFNTSAPYIFSDNNSIQNTYWNQAVFEFPVADLASQQNLQATLAIYVTFSQYDSTPSVSGAQLRYCGVGTGSVQYREYPTIGQTLATFDASSSGWQTFDVSGAIQDAADNGYPWAVFSTYVPAGQSALFGASESGDHAPSITVVPEPAMTAYAAMACLVLRRHRRKQ